MFLVFLVWLVVHSANVDGHRENATIADIEAPPEARSDPDFIVQTGLATIQRHIAKHLHLKKNVHCGFFAYEVLTSLCSLFDNGNISGEACTRLCQERHWNVTNYFHSNKTVIVLNLKGHTVVLKTLKPYIEDYEDVDKTLDEDTFIAKVLQRVNNELMLGWPPDLARHLLSTLWPSSVRSAGLSLTHADRRSLWSLLQQPEYLLFRVIPLSRVTPKVVGSCGHLYEVERLEPFRLKESYMSMRQIIPMYSFGTATLLYLFLNEPLQWCDIRFDNLATSSEYPQRFMIIDGDGIYTKSRLRTLLTSRSCTTDQDCMMGDCHSRCLSNSTCSARTNENIDIFCGRLLTTEVKMSIYERLLAWKICSSKPDRNDHLAWLWLINSSYFLLFSKSSYNSIPPSSQ